MKRIFAVSDVHGHATELREALLRAGFEAANGEHLLISCGDHFDRGGENRRVMEYLRGIPNKALLRGNHEDQLLKILDRGYLTRADFHNGTDITLREFFGEGCINEEGQFFTELSAERELTEFIGQMADYYETERFVFTHGWIPTKKGVMRTAVDPDWRYADRASWEKCRFDGWHEQYSKGLTLPDRTLVVGHRFCAYGYLFDPKRSQSDPTIFCGDGVVAIDGGTVRSGQVNVFVVEEEDPHATVSMHLDEEPFAAVKRGQKTVELRLLDEKRRSLKTGDRISFVNDGGEELTVQITGLYAYPDFGALMKEFTPWETGMAEATEEEAVKAMEKYYTPEQVRKHGVLAIGICLTGESV